MCVMMTEIYTIDGGQKDALLRKANIKTININLNLKGGHLSSPKFCQANFDLEVKLIAKTEALKKWIIYFIELVQSCGKYKL